MLQGFDKSLRWGRLAVTACVIACLGACVTPPYDYPRDSSVAIDPGVETSLKRQVDAWLAENPGPSGVYPLVGGMEAFGARLALIDRAEKSIDAQYFLMKGDSAGRVFAGALLRAADRGVRVRFLLDDVFTEIRDEELLLIDAHPNIDVRLYNPISRRGFYYINIIGQYRRANRRMHNKSLTIDNQLTIVGGRNIADEYFELSAEGEFLDLDVLGAGPVARDVSVQFDRFWNHAGSVPIEALSNRITDEELEIAGIELSIEWQQAHPSIYGKALNADFARALTAGELGLVSAPVDVLTDDPEKLESPIANEHMKVVNELGDVIRAAEEEIIVITPYLVPGRDGIAFWRSLVDKGCRVVIVTNSLVSTNHTPVHAAYANYRRGLLRAGVELYEVRADAVSEPGNGDRVTLHTKGMIIDRSKVFIGSLNQDPRSYEINSELGLLIRSSRLGGELAERFLHQLPNLAYRVEFDGNHRLQWRGNVDGVEVVETGEPLASPWRKFVSFLARIVPENQL